MDNSNVKFLSCEPLQEQIVYSNKQLGILDWIIIGALKHSENTNRQPKREWVETLVEFAKESDAKVYFKKNLTVQTSLANIPKEWPA